jgi:hypothetical protein
MSIISSTSLTGVGADRAERDGSSSVEVDDIVGKSMGRLVGKGSTPSLGLKPKLFLDGLGIEVDSHDSMESLWSIAVSRE